MSRPRKPLSRERILRAALEIVDREGLEELSMRKVADALEVEAMSLYNHVANKAAMLDGAIIYALRLDRGLSPAKVLSTVPGTHWDEERGLDERQYIVPGAGGVGEILNNAWV